MVVLVNIGTIGAKDQLVNQNFIFWGRYNTFKVLEGDDKYQYLCPEVLVQKVGVV